MLFFFTFLQFLNRETTRVWIFHLLVFVECLLFKGSSAHKNFIWCINKEFFFKFDFETDKALISISQSSWWLEVSLWSRFYFLYNKANLLLISWTLDISKLLTLRGQNVVPLYIIYCNLPSIPMTMCMQALRFNTYTWAFQWLRSVTLVSGCLYRNTCTAGW